MIFLCVWCTRTGRDPDFEMLWYPARYSKAILGIFPVGDITSLVSPDQVLLDYLFAIHFSTDVCPYDLYILSN